MLPILGTSVIALALCLERAWYWFFLALVRDRKLRARLHAGDSPPPSGQTVRDPIARVLVEAVRRPEDLGVASARAEAALRESKAYLALLRFAGGTAALLGLLGTTFAVREAFRTTVDPARLNVAIANALHATILGLIVFLFVHTAAAVFHAFSASLAREMDEHLDEVARVLRRVPIPRPASPTTDGTSGSRPTPEPETSPGGRVEPEVNHGPSSHELADELARACDG
jgi:biopolymer transport protein ExbB/TolQ